MGGAWSRRFNRRGFARIAGLGAGAVGLAAGVGALTSAAAGRPASTGGRIHLLVGIPYQGASNFQGVPQQLVDDYIAKNWLPSHPGVEVTTMAGPGCNGTCLDATVEIAASLAGQPADVIEGCCQEFVEYIAADMLVPVEPYLRQDNISLSGFSAGHLQVLTTTQGLMALPQYDGPPPIMVNLGMLDDLGLAYPEPDWTYEQATDLWRSIAGVRHGQRVYGMGMFPTVYEWVMHGFGGTMSNPARTRWMADSPHGVQAFSWFIPLFWENVANMNWAEAVVEGQAAMGHLPSWELQYAVLNARALKWDIFPPPVFPSGKPATYVNSDFNGMNAASKNPTELVWDIFKFITLDAGFARLQYSISLFTPNQQALWPEWFEVVQATVPPLRGKHLEYFQQAVGYGWPQIYMTYDGVQSVAIEDSYFQKMMSRQIGIVEGLQQQTQQINALQSAGRTTLAGERHELAEDRHYASLEAASRRPITLPAAPRTGLGTPPVQAPTLVQVNTRTGSITLKGSGVGYTQAADGLTFACAQDDSSEGVFACRLTSIARVDNQSLVTAAKIGLMARGDLSNNGTAVALLVGVDKGVHFQVRDLAGAPTAEYDRPQANSTSGLIGSTALLVPSSQAAANYLLKPVWLKMVRQGGTWTPYTSWDGRSWTQAMMPTPCTMLGAWVGVFATSHESGHFVQATFDHLTGFHPTTFVRIGSP